MCSLTEDVPCNHGSYSQYLDTDYKSHGYMERTLCVLYEPCVLWAPELSVTLYFIIYVFSDYRDLDTDYTGHGTVL